MIIRKTMDSDGDDGSNRNDSDDGDVDDVGGDDGDGDDGDGGDGYGNGGGDNTCSRPFPDLPREKANAGQDLTRPDNCGQTWMRMITMMRRFSRTLMCCVVFPVLCCVCCVFRTLLCSCIQCSGISSSMVGLDQHPH